MQVPKNFLLIEHGNARKEFTIKKIKAKNLNFYLACAFFPDWLSHYISKDNVIVTDPYNSVKLLNDVTAYMHGKSVFFDAAGTFFEDTVTQTADLASALGLIGIDPGAARRSSANKLLMRMYCQRAGIPSPLFYIMEKLTLENLKWYVEKIGFPCVVKPILGAESHGVLKLERHSDLETAIKEITQNVTPRKIESFINFNGQYLIEEYLEGSVVSVDGIIQDSVVWIAGMTEFLMGPEPRFTQETNFIPARIDESISRACQDMTRNIVRALNFNNCGFHCELRLTHAGPRLIEIACRLPGGPLQPGYQMATGIDLTSLLIDVWLGKKISMNRSDSKQVMQKAVYPCRTGTITCISGIEKVKTLDFVWDAFQIMQVGDSIVTYPEVPIPLYYYAIISDRKDELEFLSKEVEQTVRVEIAGPT